MKIEIVDNLIKSEPLNNTGQWGLKKMATFDVCGVRGLNCRVSERLKDSITKWLSFKESVKELQHWH